MRELFVVRHGQASFGAENYDKLSALGHQQSQWLGDYFRARNIIFSQVWTGSLVRHRETAQGVLSQLPTPVTHHVDEKFNEFDFNSIVRAYLKDRPLEALADSASRSEFYRLLKKAMLAWSQKKLAPLETTETWQDFKCRVIEGLLLFQVSEVQGPILLVSSGGTIAMMLSVILGLPDEQVIELNMQIRNTSFSHFYFNRQHIRLNAFNAIGHLDTLERIPSITFS